MEQFIILMESRQSQCLLLDGPWNPVIEHSRARTSHSNPYLPRTPASISTRCMVNNCVAYRDQLPSSQRHVHLGQLPLQIVDTAAIAREVSIQQLPARAIPPGSGFPSQ